jgi:hypothetical protein
MSANADSNEQPAIATAASSPSSPALAQRGAAPTDRSSPSTNPGRAKRILASWRLSGWNVPLHQLHAELTDLEIELKNSDWSISNEKKLQAACSYLDAAKKCDTPKEIDEAWMHLYRAREELVGTYDAAKIQTSAKTLSAEVDVYSELLGASRVRVIKDLLAGDFTSSAAPMARTKDIQDSEDLQLTERRERLKQAYWNRNRGLSETFLRLKVLRHFQWLLLGIGLLTLGATIPLVAIYAPDFDVPNWKAGAIPCILAALFGVVGAITSAAQRSTKMSGVTLIGELQALGASFSRVPIGAVAGLTIWLFSVAAVGDAAMNLNVADMLLAAFGAGFAERLIVQGARPETPNTGSR